MVLGCCVGYASLVWLGWDGGVGVYWSVGFGLVSCVGRLVFLCYLSCGWFFCFVGVCCGFGFELLVVSFSLMCGCYNIDCARGFVCV